MTTFDERKRTFEEKFVHDEGLRFKATARRKKMLGLWTADKLGLTGPEAEAYAKEVVMVDVAEGAQDVFRKVRQDFDAKGVAQTDHQIRRTIEELMSKALIEGFAVIAGWRRENHIALARLGVLPMRDPGWPSL